MPCSACAVWLVWPATLSTADFVASDCSGCSAAGKNAETARNISAARTDLMVDIGPAAFWGHPQICSYGESAAKLPHREKFHKFNLWVLVNLFVGIRTVNKCVDSLLSQ